MEEFESFMVSIGKPLIDRTILLSEVDYKNGGKYLVISTLLTNHSGCI
jgi:hypothetical protein